MSYRKLLQGINGVTLVILFVVGCGSVPAATPVAEAPAQVSTPEQPVATPTSIPPTATFTPVPPTATPTPELPAATPTPIPRPKTGFWMGKDVTFTVTEDGRLQDLILIVPFGPDTCTYSPPENIPIVNNKFETGVTTDDAELAERIGTTHLISFTGTFETETTLSAIYSVAVCGSRVSVSVSPDGKHRPHIGKWAASWLPRPPPYVMMVCI